MRVMVTGAAGMLGKELVEELSSGHEVRGVDLEDCDITDDRAVRSLFEARRPDLVVHCAGFTDVEGAEKNPRIAMEVNGRGAANVAASCKRAGAGMFLISTDFVFDGTKGGPYLESDEPGPVNAYGRSKLQGEKLAREALPGLTVLRTAWLYGAAGDNFLYKILKAASARACIQVVDDEVGSPTWTVDLARAMREIIDLSVSGPLYHLAGGGAASRYDLAKELFSMMGIRDCRIEPVSADNFPLSARRPADSSLASEHLEREGITPMRPWREALQDFVDQYLKEEMAGRMVR